MEQVLLLFSLSIKPAEKHHRDAHIHTTRTIVLCLLCLSFWTCPFLEKKNKKQSEIAYSYCCSIHHFVVVLVFFRAGKTKDSAEQTIRWLIYSTAFVQRYLCWCYRHGTAFQNNELLLKTQTQQTTVKSSFAATTVSPKTKEHKQKQGAEIY